MSERRSGEDLERRLRDAVRTRAAEVRSIDEEAALMEIERRVASRQRRGYRRGVAVAAALVVVAAGVAIGLARRDSSSTLTTPPAGSSSPVASSPPAGVSAPTPPDFGGLPVWPASAGQRFGSREAVAKSFALDYLGMAPVSSVETKGDTVLIRATGAGAATMVETRNTATGWIVTGAHTDQIVLDGLADGSPAPATVSGRAAAFEAQIVIEVRPFGSTVPTETISAMGGATGLAPFSASLDNRRAGVLVLRAPDASGGGSTSYATVLRIGDTAPPPPPGYDGTILARTPSGEWLNVTSAQPAPAQVPSPPQPVQDRLEAFAGSNPAAYVGQFVNALGPAAHATLRSERDLAYVDRNGVSVWNLDVLTGRAEVLFDARHTITSLDANVLGGLIFTDDRTGLWRWDAKDTNPAGPVKMTDGYVDALW